MKPKCTECRYAVLVDDGYSNWTVEGTTFWCMADIHPQSGTLDSYYGEEPELNFAETCPMFFKGEAVEFDVDQEEPFDSYFSDPIQQLLFKLWNKKTRCIDFYS